MTIKRFNPQKASDCPKVFYIQSHGLNAGRPLKKPIPNSWEIETENKRAFEICFVVFNSNILQPYLRGSVIPFIALQEYKKIIQPFLKFEIDEETNKNLKNLNVIDKAIEVLTTKNQLYRQLKNILALEVIKKLNAQN